jgi:ubiquinone biosynthesis protein COQ9
MSPMSQTHPDQDLNALENRVVDAALALIGELGFSFTALKAAADACALSPAERDLAFPNGAQDLAALLWRRFDGVFDDADFVSSLSNLKIREKIARLLEVRIEAAAKDETVAHRLMGFLALPHNLPLHQRLVWATSDRLWRLAGDVSTDENHYSKRLIAEAILTTATLTRITRGRDAMLTQIDDNISAVMAFEKFKAKIPFKPGETLHAMASIAGRLRFGSMPSPVREAR